MEANSMPSLAADQRRFPLGLALLALLAWPAFLAAQTEAGGNSGKVDAQVETKAPPTGKPTETDTGTEGGDEEGAKSSPEAIVAYSKGANLQNNSQFDLAADAWQAFLKDHADDPKAPDARYNLGVCLLQQKQFGPAREQFQQLVDSGAEFDRHADALLNLGWSAYSLGLQNDPTQFAAAADAFQKFLETYAEHTFRDQAMFFRAESLYLQGKRAEAVELYERLLADFPESKLRSDAMYALGVSHQELGKAAEAGRAFDQLLTAFPDSSLKDEVRMRKGETLLATNQLAEAEKQFAEVASVEKFASADHALYRQATAVARQERFAEAAELFASLPDRFPTSRYARDAVMASGRAYFRADQSDKAAGKFEQVLADDASPHRQEAAHWRARLALKAQQPTQALDLVDKMLATPEIDKHAFHVTLLLDRADAVHELPERRGESLDLYVKLFEQHPRHSLAPQALYNAAYTALELKEYARGIELSKLFLEQYPQHRLVPDVKHVQAECELQSGNAAAAAETFSQLAQQGEAREETSQWQLRTAVAFYAEKKYAEVLKVLATQKEETQTADERAEAAFLAGMSHLGLEQWEPGRDALQRSLTLQPRWRQADEALLNLSRTQRRLKDMAGARAAAERLIAEFPESPLLDQAVYRLAEYQYADGELEPAIVNYRRVLQDWPDSPLRPFVLYGLGWAELKASQQPKAVETFTQLLDKHATHSLAPQTRYARGLARQQAGQPEEALRDLADFLATEPPRRELSDARYVEGLCQVARKDYAAATKALRGILDEDADYPARDKVLYELAWALKQQKNVPQALDAFRQLTTAHADSPLAIEAFYHQGEANYDQKKWAEASVDYRQAADRLKNASELGERVLYKLGWSLYQQQMLPDAQAAFARQVADHPQGVYRGDAYFMQGECLLQQSKPAEALAMYQQAKQLPLSSEQITTLAYLHAGQAAGQTGAWQDSLKWLGELVAKYPRSPYQALIQYEQAVAYQKTGNTAEATRLLTQVADRNTGELAARARFRLGEIYQAAENHTAAIREYRRVMFEFDGKNTPEVKPWQSKAGLAAGQSATRLAEQQRNDRQRRQYTELASRLFLYVTKSHPQSSEAPSAREQMEKLGTQPASR